MSFYVSLQPLCQGLPLLLRHSAHISLVAVLLEHVDFGHRDQQFVERLTAAFTMDDGQVRFAAASGPANGSSHGVVSSTKVLLSQFRPP